ncbi:MAG TPA: hypothetical protein VGL18_03405 [Actinomycetota bacterium]|jgi:hypothetical protein
MAREHTFKLSVLGRYPNRLKENEPAVTVNLMAGHDKRLVYAGTLTMSQSEWETFASALKSSLGDRVDVDQEHWAESSEHAAHLID